MFEKEAEKRAKKLEESQILGVYDREEDYERNRGWNESEVAGYEEGFQDGAEFGYNKANEWHYAKDGLPEELHDVLCFVINNEHRFVLQGYLRDRRWVLSHLGTYLNNDDVIAWKEIVLPELKESE